MTDEAIVQQALQGDRTAYRLIVERYQNVVFACARAVTGNDAEPRTPRKKRSSGFTGISRSSIRAGR